MSTCLNRPCGAIMFRLLGLIMTRALFDSLEFWQNGPAQEDSPRPRGTMPPSKPHHVAQECSVQWQYARPRCSQAMWNSSGLTTWHDRTTSVYIGKSSLEDTVRPSGFRLFHCMARSPASYPHSAWMSLCAVSGQKVDVGEEIDGDVTAARVTFTSKARHFYKYYSDKLKKVCFLFPPFSSAFPFSFTD